MAFRKASQAIESCYFRENGNPFEDHGFFPDSCLRKNDESLCFILLGLGFILLFMIGCAPSWQGNIIYLENGKLVIRPESENEIKSGQKLLIYRQKTIIHPVTNEELGMIEDDIAEVSVLRVNKRTVTALAKDPWFDMMMIDDNAVAVRGSEKPFIGSVIEVGKIESVSEDDKTAEISGNYVNDTLTVIKYADAIADPDSHEIIAVAVEPVAEIIYKDGKYHYDLIDRNLGWIEFDDVIVKRTGEMTRESRWYQDPPPNFSDEMIYKRNYLRAIRNISRGLYKEALLELEIVNKANPNYEDSGFLTGFCYARINRYEDALKHFGEYLKNNRSDVRALTELAYIHQEQNRLFDAIKAYEQLAGFIADDPGIWIDMGDIYRQIGDDQKAREAYLKALEIDPINAEAEYELRTRD